MKTETAPTTVPAKKITLATLKSFIRKNRDNLLVKTTSTFDGMTDCVEQNPLAAWKPARPDSDRGCCVDNTLGLSGVWLVLGGGDRVKALSVDGIVGFEVYNCCGSFSVGVRS